MPPGGALAPEHGPRMEPQHQNTDPGVLLGQILPSVEAAVSRFRALVQVRAHLLKINLVTDSGASEKQELCDQIEV